MRNEACAGRGGHGMGSAAPCEAFSMVPKLRPSLYVRGVHASPRISGAKGGRATDAFFCGLLCGVFARALMMPYHGIARHAERTLLRCT